MTVNTATPMLRQYQAIKAQHKDCILFFRLGDFYEMFYEDAQVASRILDLVLTARGKGTSNSAPMCGIPHHAAENYIGRLIKAGKKVAICEQTEDPAATKGIVKRDVIRIITSGTYLDEATNDSRYILCLSLDKQNFGLAFIDPASGTIQTNQSQHPTKALEIMARLPIYECIFPAGEEKNIKMLFNHPLLRIKNIVLSPLEDWHFNPDIAKKALCEHFQLPSLRGFGIEDMPASISSAGALLEYLKQMNKQPLRHIDKIALYAEKDYAYISPAANYGLELESVLKTIDYSLTSLGKRKLRYWLYHPLQKPAPILQRQAAVTLLKQSPDPSSQLRTCLKLIPDIEKSISKLSCGYTHARDLLAIRNSLEVLPQIKEIIEPLSRQNQLFLMKDIPKLRSLLTSAINPGIPLSNAEGKIIQPGFHQELDDLRAVQETGRQWLKNFQEKEARRTGINSLKVGYNKVFGYYIEISKSNLRHAPQDYIRKQTLVNAERYITPELKDYEEKILTAQEKILKIESQLVRELQIAILDHSADLHLFAQSVATLDALLSLARLAERPGYVAPEINEEPVLDIQDGRHPVVEGTLTDAFVPNDTYLDCDQNHLIILTGPNMAGKSTYIRQTAILVILAQMGSYLPAKKARIGVVDKIFTRIGAHDDISKGQSTFMVEMNEMADILHNLTDRSLVILDEIGRGTSTYDGLSLAWALAEHLQQNKTRTMFATHFHELTALADEFPGVKNYNVAIKEWRDEVIFLHKIVAGSTDDSYGIYVAKLAGIPPHIIQRSKQVLSQLELNSNMKQKLSKSSAQKQQIDFFGYNDIHPSLEEIKSVINALDINSLTPLEALNELQALKQKFNQ